MKKVLSFIAAGALASALMAGARADAPLAAHPDVDPGEECASCHRELTPEVVQQWDAGPHGVNLVKCFVCHRSTGPDFVARPKPEPATCGACHPAQLDSLRTPFMKGKDCFTCHPPHRLQPHAEGVVEGDRPSAPRSGGSDMEPR